MSTVIKDGYIPAQIERLRKELQQVKTQHESARKQVAADHDKSLSEAAADMRRDMARLCERATVDSIARAERTAWTSALTLAAPWGPGQPQAFAWLGLLLGGMVVSSAISFGPISAFIFFLLPFGAGYVALVRWGKTREALRRSAAERNSIDAFCSLKPVLITIDSHPSHDPQYQYKATIAPAAKEGDALSQTFRFGKEYGSQFGATFIGLHADDGKLCLLSRLPVDGLSKVVIPFNDFTKDDLKWPVWSRLAEDLAVGAEGHGSTIRQFAMQVSSWLDASSRARMIEQRIETLEGQERAWADVALPEETLDGILRLVDSFKSGRPLKGILLYGPPGTGKTLIARKLAQHSGCNFVAVGVSDLKGAHIGHTGPRVKEVWEKCRKGAPTILFVDECESVFAARGSADSDSFSEELVQTFLAEWDGFNQSAGQVFVIGATNRQDLIDNAIMSRFTESIEIAPPDAMGRRKILVNELAKANLRFELTDDMARETAGMSGRDINTLVEKVVASNLHGEVTPDAFLAEVRKLRGKQSTSIERLGWESLILPDNELAEFKSLGRELVHAEDMRKLGVSVPRGILLYGPPGTGKTQVARVLASESGLAFIAASSSDLKANYLGQSGNRVKQLFEKARSQAPCILFMDEIDTVAKSRDSGDSLTTEIVAQLLQELDGVATRHGQVFLLAASNHPDSIDSALMSRFERKIRIGLPDEQARAAILGLQLAGKPLAFSADDACANLAGRTEGKSGRDLQSLVTSATRKAVQRAMETQGDPRLFALSLDDLESSLSNYQG